jgi:hypothetical protein
MHIQLNDQEDNFTWKLTSNGVFTVKLLYLDLMNDNTQYLHKDIWKLKVPLKIRIFMWFLHRKVILTKDNLARRNWHGSLKCCFCNQDETIEHLFISCPLVKIMWRIIHIALNITPPNNITHLFGDWLLGIDKHEKMQIQVGACALLWAIWNTRNDYVFNKTNKISFLQVIPLTTHWIRTWSLLQPEERRQDMAIGCSRLETVARDLFNQFSWRPVFRVTC